MKREVSNFAGLDLITVLVRIKNISYIVFNPRASKALTRIVSWISSTVSESSASKALLIGSKQPLAAL